MRAERRVHAVMVGGLILAGLLASSQVWAFGGLVTPEGNGTIVATRAIVARGADEARIVVQMRYSGTPATAVWLIPLPNSVMMGGEVSARAEGFPQSGFDALAAETDPRLTGECDGQPTGMAETVGQIEQFGPAPAMQLPTRFFTAAEILEGDVTDYLDSVGLTADMAMSDAITQIANQNFMLLAVRIDTAMLGVNRVDPIIALRYPNDGQVRLGLRMLAPSSPMVADLVVWTLDTTRMRGNVPTTELAYDTVRFIAPSVTNYTEAFDAHVAPQQSQALVVEAAQPVDQTTFADADLAGLIADTGATYLTRLHGRIVPAALRNNLAFISLREDAGGVVSNEHAVVGIGCGMVEPDMGVVDMGETPTDMGEDPEGDMGETPGDLDGGADSDAEADEGGGGGAGGCFAAPGHGSRWPALLLLPFLLWLPGLRRRR